MDKLGSFLINEIVLDDIALFDGKTRVHIKLNGRYFRIEIVPHNPKAARIVLTSNEMWFGLEIGKMAELDLDEEPDFCHNKIEHGFFLIKSVICNGFSETIWEDTKGVFEWEATIPTIHGPYEFRRTDVVRKALARKPISKEEIVYEPYAGKKKKKGAG